MKKIVGLLSLLFLICTTGVAYATNDFSSTNFTSKSPVIEGLSSFSTSTHFQVRATIPYISGFNSSSSNFALKPDFENFGNDIATTTPPTSSQPPPVTGNPPPPLCPGRGDLNSDCRVDLTDFSIAAFWWERTPLSPAFSLIEIAKLNGDGMIDLTDFSIMAYYWTG